MLFLASQTFRWNRDISLLNCHMQIQHLSNGYYFTFCKTVHVPWKRLYASSPHMALRKPNLTHSKASLTWNCTLFFSSTCFTEWGSWIEATALAQCPILSDLGKFIQPPCSVSEFWPYQENTTVWLIGLVKRGLYVNKKYCKLLFEGFNLGKKTLIRLWAQVQALNKLCLLCWAL